MFTREGMERRIYYLLVKAYNFLKTPTGNKLFEKRKGLEERRCRNYWKEMLWKESDCLF